MKLPCAVALMLAVAACRAAPLVPTEEEARQAVEPDLWRFGETVDFAGVGAERVELPVGFRVRFRAAVRLTEACYWRKLAAPQKVVARGIEAELKRAEELTPEELRRVDQGGSLPPHLVPLPAGALYVLEGVVRFKPSGPGWTLDSWSAGRRGYCLEGTPSACYALHGLGA